MDIKIERLIELLHMQAPSKDHDRQLRIVAKFLKMYEKHKNKDDPKIKITLNKGNFYMTKGKADIYPCVVAHLDQVHPVYEDYTVKVIHGNKIRAYSGERRVGLGADDISGIWLALELALKFPAIKIAFFKDEEVGCLGSYKVDLTFFDDCSFVLQGDRNHYQNDFCWYTNFTRVASAEFCIAIEDVMKGFGYDYAEGFSTDVGAMVNMGLDISAANISCGYFNEHTRREEAHIDKSLLCLDFMSKLIEDFSHRRWEFSENEYDLYHYSNKRWTVDEDAFGNKKQKTFKIKGWNSVWKDWQDEYEEYFSEMSEDYEIQDAYKLDLKDVDLIEKVKKESRDFNGGDERICVCGISSMYRSKYEIDAWYCSSCGNYTDDYETDRLLTLKQFKNRQAQL